jgi:probable HAF family extracellular repeat protein
MLRVLLYGLLFTFGSTCVAQFTYAPIDVPGATATVARGINNSGETVGFYQTTSCTNYDVNVPNCPTLGFKYVHNTYTTVMVPNSTSTAVNGVNDLGDIVGFYTNADGTRHGFIWWHTGTVRTIDAPKTQYSTIAMGINKAGVVVGGVWGIGQTGTFAEGGWYWLKGNFTTLDPKGSSNGTCCQSVNGISNNNRVAGQVFYHDFWQAWLESGKDVDTWTYLRSDTFGTAVDSSANAVGYGSVSGGWFGKAIESGEGSADREGNINFMAVSYPGATSTQPFGMNDARYLAGSYVDSAGNRHGFMAQPVF